MIAGQAMAKLKQLAARQQQQQQNNAESEAPQPFFMAVGFHKPHLPRTFVLHG